MPASFLFFSVDMPFLYSSSVKGNTIEESSSLIGDNLGHLLAVTRQCGFNTVGLLDIFLIVCHAFRLLPVRSVSQILLLCCLPTPMTLASGGSPMFPLAVHQPASPSIWPAVQSLRRGLSTNPGATMWCVCGCC